MRDFIFSNSYAQDAEETDREIREKYPALLHSSERVLLAFRDRGGKGRDREFFTTHRLLIKDGKGIGNKRKNYQSIPYSSIQAFSVDTAGHFDGDVSLHVYSTGVRYVKLDFGKTNCDIYQIQQFMNGMTVSKTDEAQQDHVDATPPNMDKKQSSVGNIMDWFGDNAKQVDAATVEDTFKTTMPILLQKEKVQLGFKSGRDYTVFTDSRLMIVDVIGLGKKVSFTTVLWKSVKAYKVQTAGSFIDRDMEMSIFTNILNLDTTSQDFRHGKADLFAIQKVLCNHILGEDTDPLTNVDYHEGQVDDQKGFWWFRDNQRPLDAVEMTRVYKSSPPILRGNEVIEMAFKGRRDITLFTNLRVLIIDPKAITGKRVEYFTLPWKSIVGHAVRTAGKFVDFDTEVCFWTEKDFTPGRAGSGEDNPPLPPEPLVSYFELDFNKKMVDIHALNYYLSRRLLLLSKMDPGAPIPLDRMTEQYAAPTGVEKLWQCIGGDQRELDPVALDTELHSSTRVLLDDEKVLMAFKAGRDASIFTNLRVMLLDVQGLSGQKIEYKSIPYKSIRSWSVCTAGMWDRDTELKLHTRNRWDMAEVDMDFRTGKADIAQINRFLSALIIGLPSDKKVDFGPKDYKSGNEASNPIKGSGTGILGNSKEIDAKEIDTKLRTEPPLLLDEEKVLRAFQSGRDICAYTNRRIILIDTQGLTGKRTEYRSIPLKYVYGFEFETAGHLDRDAEIYCHTDIADVQQERFPRRVPCLVSKQSLLVKKIDIYEVGDMIGKLTIFEKEEGFAEEPEIVLS